MKNQSGKWLNKNITALGIVSLLNDFGSEIARNLVPAFLLSIGGSPAILGIIEGISDASVSGVKIIAGWYSDTLGKRKPFIFLGYALSFFGISIFPFASKWYHILFGQTLNRLGKGIREPARDALMVESTRPNFYGRMFGFHRAMDTIGAILGPLTAFFLMQAMNIQTIFAIALIPCFLSVLTIFFFVQESPIIHPSERPMVASIFLLNYPFKKFLSATLLFSLGNFATSLLILRATQLLSAIHDAATAASLAILLYTLHNITYAGCSYPIGRLTDLVGKKYILACGYTLTGITSLLCIIPTSNVIVIGSFFIVAGIAIAITDGVQRSVAADLLPANVRGTGYGALSVTIGIGNLLSNSIVGFLWANISPLAGFGYSAVLCIIGSIALLTLKK